MARAVVVSQSEAQVELSYDISGKPILGDTVEIKLAFVPTTDAAALNAEITAMPPLQLEGELKPNFSELKVGQINQHSFKASVPATATEGIYLANVVVALQRGGATVQKTFAIPIIFGKPAPTASLTGNEKSAS